MRSVSLIGLFAAAASVLACAHRASPPPAPTPSTSLALRIVDSSRAGTPLLAVRLRLIGPAPLQDIVACSDSTRQAVLWVARLRPGRYQLVLNRVGYEGRLVLVDVAQRQADTVTVGLRPSTRDLDDRVRTSPSAPHCS